VKGADRHAEKVFAASALSGRDEANSPYDPGQDVTVEDKGQAE
jgi:hypothetical protein